MKKLILIFLLSPLCVFAQQGLIKVKQADTSSNGFSTQKSLIPYLTKAQILALGYGTGTVTSIATSSGITGGTITGTGTLKADTSVLQTVLNFFPKGDTRYAKISSIITYSNARGITLASNNFGLDTTQNYTWGKVQTIGFSGLAVTPKNGLVLSTSSTAISGTQQMPGSFGFIGSGFSTSGSVAIPIEGDINMLPVQNTTATGLYQFQFKINGGAASNAMTVSSAGGVTANNSFTANAGNFGATTTAAFTGTNGTSASAGTPVQKSSGLFLNGNIWNTTSTGSNNTMNAKMYLAGTSATTPVGIINFDTNMNGGGDVTQASISSLGDLTVTRNTTVNGTILGGNTSSGTLAFGTVATSNFVSYTSNIGAVSSNSLYTFGGATNVMYRNAFGGSVSSQALGASNSYGGSIFASSAAVTASSGTNSIIANVAIKAPVITVTAGSTVTDAASLFVQAGAAGATGNWNSWFKYGLTRVSGMQLDTLTASSAVATDANKRLVSVANTGTGSNVLAASPTLTGTPTAPTAASGTNTTQIATTAYVDRNPQIKTTADLTAQSAAVTVGTFTVGASTATFNISAYLNITAVTVDVIEMQVTYTDENSTSQTATFFTQGATSALLSAIGNSVYPPLTIRAKNATTITVKTTLTTGTGSIAYDAGTRIIQM